MKTHCLKRCCRRDWRIAEGGFWSLGVHSWVFGIANSLRTFALWGFRLEFAAEMRWAWQENHQDRYWCWLQVRACLWLQLSFFSSRFSRSCGPVSDLEYPPAAHHLSTGQHAVAISPAEWTWTRFQTPSKAARFCWRQRSYYAAPIPSTCCYTDL